jgi:hypothetical protein
MALPTIEGLIYVALVSPGAVLLAELSSHIWEAPVGVRVALAAAELRRMIVD